MKILLLNGPNLNMLGKRNRVHYGTKTLSEINETIKKLASKLSINIQFCQSNHEGDLIDFIQKHRNDADGILINPGALTHYGYSLRDAVEDSGLPTIVVHLSGVKNRESFRRIDVFEGVVIRVVAGLKEKSYEVGLEKLVDYISKGKTQMSKRERKS